MKHKRGLHAETNQKATIFWGSFLDVHLNRSFDTCVKENATIVKETLFPGEMNNLEGQEPCVMVVLTPSGVGGLIDSACTSITAYNLCEVLEYHVTPCCRRHKHTQILYAPFPRDPCFVLIIYFDNAITTLVIY